MLSGRLDIPCVPKAQKILRLARLPQVPRVIMTHANIGQSARQLPHDKSRGWGVELVFGRDGSGENRAPMMVLKHDIGEVQVG